MSTSRTISATVITTPSPAQNVYSQVRVEIGQQKFRSIAKISLLAVKAVVRIKIDP